MRPKVLVYVTADELAEMRREAKRQHLSLSRYTKRRLMLASDTDGAGGESAGAVRAWACLGCGLTDFYDS